MTRDVGSIFPVSSVVPGELGTLRAGFRTEKHVRFVSLCREAFSLIARRHAIDRRKRALLPAYTCQTVIDPFWNNGWSCDYYGINLDLSINIDSLASKCRAFDPDIIVVHPYHGMGLAARELDALREMKTPGRIVVEDLTQCAFTSEADEVFDYYVGSLRKWMPMPDGAFIASNAYDFADDEISADENEPYVSTELAAMKLRGDYFATGEVRIKDVSRQVDKAAQSFVENSVVPHAMSRYSRSVLSRANFDEIVAVRRENYRYLHDHLSSGGISLICPELSRVTSAPLYFPILCRDREAVLRRLVSAGVYAPVLWPIPSDRVLIDACVRRLYSSALAVPVDQRYGTDDMDYIVRELSDAKA